MPEASLSGLGGRGVPGLCKPDHAAGCSALVKHTDTCRLADLSGLLSASFLFFCFFKSLARAATGSQGEADRPGLETAGWDLRIFKRSNFPALIFPPHHPVVSWRAPESRNKSE